MNALAMAPQRAAGAILAADPRLKLGLGLLAGVLVWASGWPGVLLCLACAAWMVAALHGAQRHAPLVARTYVMFVVFWMAIKVGVELVAGTALQTAVSDAVELGARLAALLLVGLGLALSTSARQLGLAVAWVLRPVLGRAAWRVSLAFALLVHYLPLLWTTLAQVRHMVSLRCPKLPLFRRMELIPMAVLRHLGQRTWNQTLAVVCRGLDRPEAWRVSFGFRPGEWLAGGLFALVLAAVSFL